MITDSIRDPRFDTVQILVAFATSSGVSRLRGALRDATVDQCEIYVGVDQQATTRQALEQLLATDIETITIEVQGGEITYHPKVYLFKGEARARVIVGSVN